MHAKKFSNSPAKNHLGKEDEMRMNVYSFMREGLMLFSLAVLVFLIYLNTTGCPFIFDDVPNIQTNPHVRLSRLTLEGLMKAGMESRSSNRPVANISFALNYYFHRYDVAGYHWVNILIHITTGILLYFFAKTTLSIPSLRFSYGSYGWIPFFTVSIWLVHPIHTQSVTYIVQRMNSMAAMFYVMSFLLYAKARLSGKKTKKWALFAGCILAGILGLGSKEIAATLPFFIFLYEWYFFQDLSAIWLKKYVLRFAGLLIILALAAFFFLQTEASHRILSLYNTQDFTPIQRVLTEFRVVIHYLSLLILPHPSRLNLDYDFPLSHSLVDPVTTLLSMGAIGGLIGLAFFVAKKDRLLSFGILWFLGNLIIESSVIPLALIFEHRTYLPSMLVGLTAVMLAYRHMRPRWLVVPVLGAMVVLFSIWTYQRNSVWSDEVALWKDCVEKSPKKARPHNNLGFALESRGDLKQAATHYLEALRINPDYADAHYNLGNVLARQGNFEEAVSHYSEALRFNPIHANAHNNLGNALKSQGRLKEAIRHYVKALRINPDNANAHYNLGNALARQGNPDGAIRHYVEALRINPIYANAHNNLGNALKRQGRLKEAIGHYVEALRINPDFPEAHNNLGLALAKQGRLKEATGHYIEALRINPDFPEAHNNLGDALIQQGRVKEAVNHYVEALSANPNYASAHNNLGDALMNQGMLEEAASHYAEALRINPNFPEARRNLELCLGRMDKPTGSPNTFETPQ